MVTLLINLHQCSLLKFLVYYLAYYLFFQGDLPLSLIADIFNSQFNFFISASDLFCEEWISTSGPDCGIQL